MRTNRNRVVVIDGDCDCETIHSTHAYHLDFPEIHAEGESPAHAVARLINQLAIALDTASDRWHREAVEQAIADVKFFAEQVAWDFGHRGPVETLP